MLRRILIAVAALLLLGLVALAWYVSSKGFTRKWRTFIVEEFRKAGVEVHIKRLTLDPFRGLVAKDVSVLDARDRKRVLAWFDEVLLGVNYANAMRGKTFLDSADLRDANLWLPLDPNNPDSEKLEVSKLNARFFLPPQQVYLASSQAEVHGVQVFMSGRLINPQAYKSNRSGESAALELIAEVISELSKVKYGGAAPTLTVQFAGDLEKPQEVQVDLHFSARNMRRKNYELTSVDVVANCRHGVAEVQQLRAVDARGELRANGTYDLRTREVAAHAHSTLHLEEFDRAYGLNEILDAFHFAEPPQVELNLAGAFPAPRVTGRAELPSATFQKIPLQHVEADFSWEKDRWSVRSLRVQHASGELTGDALAQPEEFRAKFKSSLNPAVFARLFDGELGSWLGRFDFVEPASLELELSGPRPELAACHGSGQFNHGKLLYQGAVVEPGRSEVKIGDGVCTVAPFPLGAEPQQLILDFMQHALRLEKLPAAEVP